MKILYITGDGDFTAMIVEQEYGIDKAVELCESNNGSYILETDDLYAELKIYEFGEVDTKFIDFIVDNFIDYDSSKNSNFYII